MLNHSLVTTLDASEALAVTRRASLGAAAATPAPAMSTAMIVAMAIGGAAGGLLGLKLAGTLGALAAGGVGVYLGHRIEASRETAAVTTADATKDLSTKESFSRADYAAALEALRAQPDFVASLDPTNSLTAAQKKDILDGMTKESLALWDTGSSADQADMAIESYARVKNVDLTLGAGAVGGADLAALGTAVKGMTATLSASANPYTVETQRIGKNLARMLRFRAGETAGANATLATSTIDDAFKKIDAAGPAPGLSIAGPAAIAATFTGPPKSPADVIARDPRPTGNPAGVLSSDWPAERLKARFPASQKVSNALPRPTYHPIIGFSGTADAPVPIYSAEAWPLEPLVVGTVLDGLYSIDGVTYWVGDPATPPGTTSGMFPVESTSGGWSSTGAKGGLYLPTQGDLYLIQQAFMPKAGETDPDKVEAFREIQELLDGAGGLRPLGPKNPSDPADPHMPPVLLNVKPVAESGGEEFTFTPEA